LRIPRRASAAPARRNPTWRSRAGISTWSASRLAPEFRPGPECHPGPGRYERQPPPAPRSSEILFVPKNLPAFATIGEVALQPTIRVRAKAHHRFFLQLRAQHADHIIGGDDAGQFVVVV